MFGFTKCANRYCGANFITTPDPRKKICRQCYIRLSTEQEQEHHRWMNPSQLRDDNDDNVFTVPPSILHGDSVTQHDIREDSRDFFQAGKSGGGGAVASFEEDREERNSSPPSDEHDSDSGSSDSGSSDSGSSDSGSCDSGSGD